MRCLFTILVRFRGSGISDPVKAAFIHGPNDLRMDEIAAPRAGRRDVALHGDTTADCDCDLGNVAAGALSARAAGTAFLAAFAMAQQPDQAAKVLVNYA